MAWLRPIRRAAAVLALGLLALPTPAAVGPRPAFDWPVARLHGDEYVRLTEVARRYDLRARWETRGRVLLLEARSGPILRFEAGNRDIHVDGVRIMLSAPIVAANGTLATAKADLVKTLTPLLRPAEVARFLPRPPKLIVLDPGHGGNDPGKQNARLKLDEKDMTLDLARRLKPLLEGRGFEVRLTRTEDRRLGDTQLADLQARAAFANEAKADLFLSLHFNALDPRDAPRVSGTETYVVTPQYMLSTGDERKDDMTDVAFPGNRQDVANVVLGWHLHRQLIKDLGTSDRGYKRARFLVLRFVECPAALLEAAYLSNDEEAARVGTPEYRQRIAESIARGVQSYAAALAALPERS